MSNFRKRKDSEPDPDEPEVGTIEWALAFNPVAHKAYSIQQKLDCVHRLDDEFGGNVMKAAKAMHVPEKRLADWKEESHLYEMVKDKSKKRLRGEEKTKLDKALWEKAQDQIQLKRLVYEQEQIDKKNEQMQDDERKAAMKMLTWEEEEALYDSSVPGTSGDQGSTSTMSTGNHKATANRRQSAEVQICSSKNRKSHEFVAEEFEPELRVPVNPKQEGSDSTRQRRSYSIQDKLDFIKLLVSRYEGNASLASRELGVDRKRLREWQKNEDELKEVLENDRRHEAVTASIAAARQSQVDKDLRSLYNQVEAKKQTEAASVDQTSVIKCIQTSHTISSSEQYTGVGVGGIKGESNDKQRYSNSAVPRGIQYTGEGGGGGENLSDTQRPIGEVVTSLQIQYSGSSHLPTTDLCKEDNQTYHRTVSNQYNNSGSDVQSQNIPGQDSKTCIRLNHPVSSSQPYMLQKQTGYHPATVQQIPQVADTDQYISRKVDEIKKRYQSTTVEQSFHGQTAPSVLTSSTYMRNYGDIPQTAQTDDQSLAYNIRPINKVEKIDNIPANYSIEFKLNALHRLRREFFYDLDRTSQILNVEKKSIQTWLDNEDRFIVEAHKYQRGEGEHTMDSLNDILGM